MSFGSGSIVPTSAFVAARLLKAWPWSEVFVAGSSETMCSSDAMDSSIPFVFSAIASVTTMRALASQSLTMNSQSFASCASYIGTKATPSPKHAYAATAHSGRLLAMIATRSPRSIPSDASPARKPSVNLPNSRYVIHDHWPPRFVPNKGLSGNVLRASW